MNTLNPPVSACRYCQFYDPIGRRGGCCKTLGVSVQAGWQGCQLAIPVFTTGCPRMQEASSQPDKAIVF